MQRTSEYKEKEADSQTQEKPVVGREEGAL